MRARSSALTLVAAGAITALALTGCAGAAPTSSGERVEGGTIVYAHQQEPACVFGGWIEQAYLSYQVLDNLVSLDENHEVVPWLAESWEASEDGLTWTFTLKEGVEFTDGTPLDRRGRRLQLRLLGRRRQQHRVGVAARLLQVGEAVDDLTVPHQPAARRTRASPTTSRRATSASSRRTRSRPAPTRRTAPPRSAPAPFIVDQWDRGQEIVLVRNDDYTSWPANAEHTGPAYVEEIDWKFVPDATTRVAALQSGEVNAIYDVPAVQWQTLDDAGYQLEKYVTPGRPQQLSFNTQVGPFTDEQVRQAFAYSLDREQIVETIGHGRHPLRGQRRRQPDHPRLQPGGRRLRTAYDPDKANELLDEAGWTERDDEGFRTKDGKRLTVVLPYGAGSIINADGAAILQGVKEQATAGRLRRGAHPGSAERAVRGRVLGTRRARHRRRLLDRRHRRHPVHQLAPEHRGQAQLQQPGPSTTTRCWRRSSWMPTRRPTSTSRTRSTARRRSTSPTAPSRSASTTGSARWPSSPKLQGRLAGARTGGADVL